MAKIAINSCLSTKNDKTKLYDGDFIDLTNEGESQNNVEDDVLLVDDTPQNEKDATLPVVNTWKKKLEVSKSFSSTETATISIINSVNNIQHTNITTHQFLVPLISANPSTGSQLLPPQSVCKTAIRSTNQQTHVFIKQGEITSNMGKLNFKSSEGVITVKEAILQNNRQKQTLKSGTSIMPVEIKVNSPPKKINYKPSGSLISVEEMPVLQNILQKVGQKTSKNERVVTLLKKYDQKAAFTNTCSKNGIKGNIKQYKRIRSVSSSPNVSPSECVSDSIDVSNVILAPSSLEKVHNGKQQQKIATLTLKTNVDVDDDVILLPSHSEDNLSSVVLKNSVSGITPLLTHKSHLNPSFQESSLRPQRNQGNKNFQQDDVIVLSDDTKEELKKPKELEKTPTCSTNILKRQLGIATNKTINILSNMSLLPQAKKDSEKRYIVVNHQQINSDSVSLQNKGFIPPKNNDQNVQITIPSLNCFKQQSNLVNSVQSQKKIFTKSLQNCWPRMNIKNCTEIVSTDKDLETVENGSSLPVEHQNNEKPPSSDISVDADVNGQVCLLMYGLGHQNSTIIPDNGSGEEIAVRSLSESKPEADFNNVYIEPEKQDPLKATTLEAYMVTPVDITKILNESKRPETVDLKDRCDSVQLKNQNLYQKGFTKREMRKPCCLKYLQTTITNNENKIQELKKSSVLYETNFVHCGSTLNNFLPEIAKYDEDDTEEFTIEYNNLEDQLNAEIYGSEALPIITNVISKVNEEVLQIKKTQQVKAKKKEPDEDLQAKLAKPEAALKLIKKGLELIKSWSKETHRTKEKAKKALPTRRKNDVVKEVKKKTKTKESSKVVVPSTSKISRSKKNDVKKKEGPKQKFVKGNRRWKKNAKAENSVIKTDSIKDDFVGRKRKIEINKEAKNTSKKGRKKKKLDFNDPNDNELFLIKKVDILKDKRRK